MADRPETVQAPTAASLLSRLEGSKPRPDHRAAVTGFVKPSAPQPSHTLHPHLKTEVRPDFRDPNYVPPPLPRISVPENRQPGPTGRPPVFSAAEAAAMQTSRLQEKVQALAIEMAALRGLIEHVQGQVQALTDSAGSFAGDEE